MSNEPVHFSQSRPVGTVMAPVSQLHLDQLRDALEIEDQGRRDRVAAVVAANLRFSDAWAQLGRLTPDPVEAYAYYRVGYHRGLDTLRASGWRGSGPVLWENESNRGFLRALDGLRSTAEILGEGDEVQRCRQFLNECDPGLPTPVE